VQHEGVLGGIGELLTCEEIAQRVELIVRREIASGGELSRVMLALMGVAAEAGPATLVFDEVDAGIGGQTARAVGEQLRELAAGRQVLCITHLPQIASLADRHFTIVKDTSGETARTTVTELKKADVVGERVEVPEGGRVEVKVPEIDGELGVDVVEGA
jgi:DNA repair ATPase RecN